MTRTRLLLRQFGAHLAIFVGAYVSLGTTCEGSSTSASLEGQTTLAANRAERHLQLSSRSDRGISRVSITITPAVEAIVDSIDGPISLGGGGGPNDPTSVSFESDCAELSCEELFLTLNRGALGGDLDISLEVRAWAGGSCAETYPDFVEIELMELD